MLVTVVGAGVSGLTAALLLLKKGYKVNCVAVYFPGDTNGEYTLPEAGAFWYTLAKNNDPDWLKELDMPAYHEFVAMANNPAVASKAGIHAVESVRYIPTEHCRADNTPWYASRVNNYRALAASELPPRIGFGYRYDGFVISPGLYLAYLFQQCLQHGMTYERRRVRLLADECSGGRTVINATGWTVGRLVPDTAVFPAAGQTMLVENCAPRLVVVLPCFKETPDDHCYVIPRAEGGSLLTGCYRVGVTSTAVDPALSKRIQERAVLIMPQLVDSSFRNNPTALAVTRESVGIRPGRTGGPRIERERVGSGTVVHMYGVDSSGFQLLFGAAQQVVLLVEKRDSHL